MNKKEFEFILQEGERLKIEFKEFLSLKNSKIFKCNRIYDN